MTTKGAFLKEKLTNMARWVQEEVGRENLPVDVHAGIADRTEVEACVFAGIIHANKAMVEQRNWTGLVCLVTKDVPEMQGVLTAINQRADMHAKFWRYMELFDEISAQ